MILASAGADVKGPCLVYLEMFAWRYQTAVSEPAGLR